MKLDWHFDENWTLFLDRDGVINKRIVGGYVTNVDSFEFLPGAIDAIVYLTKRFKTTVVVTNQQGIGKGLMSPQQVERIHDHMQRSLMKAGGRINEIYYCPDLAVHNPPNRKPNTGMAYQAKADFPHIDFEKSVIVGDSATDMEFGLKLGMKTVYIETKPEDAEAASQLNIDLRCQSLAELSDLLKD